MSVISLSSEEEECFIIDSDNEETSLKDKHRVFILPNNPPSVPQISDTKFRQNLDLLVDSFNGTNNEDCDPTHEIIQLQIVKNREKLLNSSEFETNVSPSTLETPSGYEAFILPYRNSEYADNANIIIEDVVEVNSSNKTDCAVDVNFSVETEDNEKDQSTNYGLFEENTFAGNTQRVVSESKLKRFAKQLAIALGNSNLPTCVNNPTLNVSNASSVKTDLEEPKMNTLSNLENIIYLVSKGNFSIDTGTKLNKKLFTLSSRFKSNTTGRKRGRDPKGKQYVNLRRSLYLNTINANCDTSEIEVDPTRSIQNISFQYEGMAENINQVRKKIKDSEQIDRGRNDVNYLSSYAKATVCDVNVEHSTGESKLLSIKKGRKRGLKKCIEIETPKTIIKHGKESGNSGPTKRGKRVSSSGETKVLSGSRKIRNARNKYVNYSELEDTEKTNITPITYTHAGNSNSSGSTNIIETITIDEDVNPCRSENNCTVEDITSKECFNLFVNEITHDNEVKCIIEKLSDNIYVSLAQPTFSVTNIIMQDNTDPSKDVSSKADISPSSSSEKCERNTNNREEALKVSSQGINDHDEQMSNCSQFGAENVSSLTENTNLDSSTDEQIHLRKNFVKCYGIIFDENGEQLCMKMGDLLLLSLKEFRNSRTRIDIANKLTCKHLKKKEISIAMNCLKKSTRKYNNAFSMLFIEIHNSIFKNEMIAENYPEQYKALLVAWFLKLMLRLTFLSPEFSDCLEEIKRNIFTYLLPDEILQLPFVHDVFARSTTDFERECWLILDFMKDCCDANEETDTQCCPGNIENTETTSATTIVTTDSVPSSKLQPNDDCSGLIIDSPGERKGIADARTSDELSQPHIDIKNCSPGRLNKLDKSIGFGESVNTPKLITDAGRNCSQEEVKRDIQESNQSNNLDLQPRNVSSEHDTSKEMEGTDNQRNFLLTRLTTKNDLSVIRHAPAEASKHIGPSCALVPPLPHLLETSTNKQDPFLSHIPVTQTCLESSNRSEITSNTHSSQSHSTGETSTNKNVMPLSYMPVNYPTTGSSNNQQRILHPNTPVSYAIVQPLKHTEGTSNSHVRPPQVPLDLTKNNQNKSNLPFRKTVTATSNAPYARENPNAQSVAWQYKPNSEITPNTDPSQLPQLHTLHYVPTTDHNVVNGDINKLQNCYQETNYTNRPYNNESQVARPILAHNAYMPQTSRQSLPTFYNERFRYCTPNQNNGLLPTPQIHFNSYQRPVNNMSSVQLYYNSNVHQPTNERNVAHYNIPQQQSYTDQFRNNSHNLINPTVNPHQLAYPHYFNGTVNTVVDSALIQRPVNYIQNNAPGSAVTVNNINVNMHNPTGYPGQFNYPYNTVTNSVLSAQTFRQVAPTAPNPPCKETAPYVDRSPVQYNGLPQQISSGFMQQVTNTNVPNQRNS